MSRLGYTLMAGPLQAAKRGHACLSIPLKNIICAHEALKVDERID